MYNWVLVKHSKALCPVHTIIENHCGLLTEQSDLFTRTPLSYLFTRLDTNAASQIYLSTWGSSKLEAQNCSISSPNHRCYPLRKWVSPCCRTEDSI